MLVELRNGGLFTIPSHITSVRDFDRYMSASTAKFTPADWRRLFVAAAKLEARHTFSEERYENERAVNELLRLAGQR